jgi:hypothetical protein
MARGDEDDLQDIRFILQQEQMSPALLENAFACARVPDVQEIQKSFQCAPPKVLALAAGIH